MTGIAAATGPLAEHNIRATFAVNLLGVRRHWGGTWNCRCRWCRERLDANPLSRCSAHRRPIRTDASDVVDAADGRCHNLPGPERRSQKPIRSLTTTDCQDRRGRRPSPCSPDWGPSDDVQREWQLATFHARRAQRELATGRLSPSRFPAAAALYPGSAGSLSTSTSSGVSPPTAMLRSARATVGQLPRGGAVHSGSLSDDVRQPALDHPRYAGFSTAADSNALPQTRRGPEGPVGGVRPATHPRL